MAPPIAQVRSAYSRFATATADSVGATVSTLSPRALTDAVQVRSSVLVPVSAGLRHAAWFGLCSALLAAMFQPWLLSVLNRSDGFQNIVAAVLDRGTWWTIAAAASACVAFVGLVFSDWGRHASRAPLVALALGATGGSLLGIPLLLAAAIGVVALVVVVVFGMMLAWLAVQILIGLWDS